MILSISTRPQLEQHLKVLQYLADSDNRSSLAMELMYEAICERERKNSYNLQRELDGIKGSLVTLQDLVSGIKVVAADPEITDQETIIEDDGARDRLLAAPWINKD